MAYYNVMGLICIFMLHSHILVLHITVCQLASKVYKAPVSAFVYLPKQWDN